MKKLIVTTVLFICFAIAGPSQDTIKEKQTKNKPKATYQIGSAKVTVWENKRTGKYGEFTAKNFEVEKIYKKDGKWKSTNNFNEKEILELKVALDKAISEEQVKVKVEKKEVK